MLRACLLPTLVASFAATASAQTIVVKPSERPMLMAAAAQVRISVGVNFFVPAADDGSEQALKAQEDGRRRIYELAGHECAILRDVLAAECQLESVNVNVQRLRANQFGGQQMGEGFNINGNIGFRIVPK